MIEKIILHAGSPKTGTTSLQWFMFEHREWLREQGILYGPVESEIIEQLLPPKHVWLPKALRTNDSLSFMRRLKEAFIEARSDTHVLFLSNETIYGRWPEFTDAGLQPIRKLRDHFQTEIWIWLREPASYARSQYIQILKNPRRYTGLHGQNISFEDFVEHPWLARRLDYAGFVQDARALCGPNSVRVFKYDGNTLGQCLRALDLSLPVEGIEDRRNTSVGDVGVKFLRAINDYPIGGEEKRTAVRLIEQIDRLFPDEEADLLSITALRRIHSLSEHSRAFLREEFAIEFASKSAEQI